jgi:hypothetical protein
MRGERRSNATRRSQIEDLLADIGGRTSGRRAENAFLNADLDLKAGTGQILVVVLCDLHAEQEE